MPIYEFYCSDCHTRFSFFARRYDTETEPACPRCERPALKRQVSMFSISKGRPEPEEGAEDLPAGLDEAKLMQAMDALSQEADGMDEDDPLQMAGMVRKLYDATGLRMGGGMEEALRRLEAGEDPDAIEAELGDVLEDEGELFAGVRPKAGLETLRKKLPARVDPKLYELHPRTS